MTTLYCNDFWRVCISVPMVSYEIMNVVHYDHNQSTLVFKILLSSGITVIIFALVSIMVMFPGKLIVNNKVMRKDNKKLLNNLKESVIIAHR